MIDGPSAIDFSAVHGLKPKPSVCMSLSERTPGYLNRSHVPPMSDAALEDDVGAGRAEGLQVIPGADARDPGADHDHIHVLNRQCCPQRRVGSMPGAAPVPTGTSAASGYKEAQERHQRGRNHTGGSLDRTGPRSTWRSDGGRQDDVPGLWGEERGDSHRCRICTAVLNPGAPEGAAAAPDPPPAPLAALDHFDADEINRQMQPTRTRFGSGGGGLSARIAAVHGDGAAVEPSAAGPAPAPAPTTPTSPSTRTRCSAR